MQLDLDALAASWEQLRAADSAALEPLPFPNLSEPGPDASTVRAHLSRLHDLIGALIECAHAASDECAALRSLVTHVRTMYTL